MFYIIKIMNSIQRFIFDNIIKKYNKFKRMSSITNLINITNLTKNGIYVNKNLKELEKLYTVELPIPPMVATMAKQRGYKPKPETMSVFKHINGAILIPRNAISNPDFKKLIGNTPINFAAQKTPDLPSAREFAIDPLGNQELIINYLMEKKYNENRLKHLIGTALLQLGTGYGKTYIAATIIHKIGKKTLWVLPNTSILEQTMEVLTGAFPDLKIGVWYTQGHDDPAEHDIILAIIDSLLIIREKNEACAVRTEIIPGKKRPKKENITYNYEQWINLFGLTIYDEVHKYVTPVYSEVFWWFSSPVVFAMSATVNENRNNLDIIYKMHFGEEIISENIPGFQKDELQWRGRVSAIKYQNPPQFSNIIINPITNMLSCSNLISQFVADPERNKLIINCLKSAIEDKHNVFVFCEYREHCEKLALLYKAECADTTVVDNGDEILFVDNNTSILLRGGATPEEVDIARKNANVIFTTYAYTNVGVSIPRMSCIIFATPRKNNMTQIIGRIERRGGDVSKERLIYDIIDDLTPLRKQFNTRKIIYKIKGY
jgi:superfamily II DNA or RNA helicase